VFSAVPLGTAQWAQATNDRVLVIIDCRGDWFNEIIWNTADTTPIPSEGDYRCSNQLGKTMIITVPDMEAILLNLEHSLRRSCTETRQSLMRRLRWGARSKSSST
jgi:hypothetical protein